MATKKITKASKIATRKTPATGSVAAAVLGRSATAKAAAPKAKGAAPSKGGGGVPPSKGSVGVAPSKGVGETPPMGASAQLRRGVMALAKRCRESKDKSFAKAEPALNHLAKAYERLLGKS